MRGVTLCPSDRHRVRWGYVGVTDKGWYEHLSSRLDIDEANFWRPKDAPERFVERILTVTATIRRRGENVFDYLADVSAALAHNRSPPALVALPTAR